MKKPQTTAQKPVAASKAEQPVAAQPSKTTAAPKETSTAQPTPKKTKAAEPKAKEQQVSAAVATEAAPAPKKSTSARPKKTETKTPKPAEVVSELTMPERVGLTAGNIWHFLSENGATPVSKLIKALEEEEKIVQRSIGWLAQEDKIAIEDVDRIETIALK